MENRIKIGDVWYVREDAIRDPLDHLENEEIEMNVTTFDGRVFESDLYCYEATRIYDDKNMVYDTACGIEITDKRVKPWKVHNLDNPLWYIGVLENNPESMVEAREMFCECGIIEFRIFIRDLVNENWIKKN